MMKTGDSLKGESGTSNVSGDGSVYAGAYVDIKCWNKKVHYILSDGGDAYTVCGACDCKKI